MLLFKFIHLVQAVLILAIAPLLLLSCGVALLKGRWRGATSFGLGSFVAVGLYMCSGIESYCYVYPSIDTRYAPGFSEGKFAEVHAGMSKEEVVRLLGDPLGGISARESSRWSYSGDGKCHWADWAWLGRHVVFENEVVVETIARVWYD